MTIAEEIDESATPPADAPKPAHRRPVLMWLAGFLLVVIAAELGVRLTEKRLPEPARYFPPNAQRFIHDMDVLQAHGIRSDLTFVGTSMARRDIAGNQIERELPGMKWVHNVALPGTQTPLLERWMLDEVVPRLHPKRVVWAVSSLEFNGGRSDQSLDQWEQARATQTGFYGDMDRLVEHSAVSEYRTSLRDPLTIAQALEGKGKQISVDAPLQDRATWKVGYPKHTAQQIARLKREHLTYVRNTQLSDYRVGDEHLGAFRRTLAALRRSGIEVAVVVLPVPTGYLAAHPHGARDYASWKTLITSAAEGTGASVVDLSRSMPDDRFRDYEHLNADAATEFTKTLASRLDALGW